MTSLAAYPVMSKNSWLANTTGQSGCLGSLTTKLCRTSLVRARLSVRVSHRLQVPFSDVSSPTGSAPELLLQRHVHAWPGFHRAISDTTRDVFGHPPSHPSRMERIRSITDRSDAGLGGRVPPPVLGGAPDGWTT
eukprot:scaffold631_cov318-Pavlova_lutheri.AAC.11